MTGKIAGAAVLLAALLGSAGCATCHHAAAELALCPPDCPDTCAGQRNRVHLVLVNGADPCDFGGLAGLRDRVNAAGFSQVYYGYPYHGGWLGREVRRAAAADPEARFVVVGYELGAASAVSLACDARGHGAHVEAVVLLDPAGATAAACAAAGVPVHVIRSAAWPAGSGLPAASSDVLPEIGHFSVPTDPLTVERVVGLMRDAGGRVPRDEWGPLVLPLLDDPAPLPAVVPDPPAAPPGSGELIRRPGPVLPRTRPTLRGTAAVSQARP